MKKTSLLIAACAILASASPAMADGNVRCGGGPRAGWKSLASVQQALKAQGWTIKKVKPENDCYEVYGKTPEGLNVEAFFHPVTLKKVRVLQRGRVIFPAPK